MVGKPKASKARSKATASRAPSDEREPGADEGAKDLNDRSIADTSRIAGLDAAAFAQRFFQPAYTQRAEALASVAGVSDPSEAWEVLAARELISLDWVSAGARQVAVDGAPCELCEDRVEFVGHDPSCERANVPATVLAAATLAADPAGVVAAERLAREAYGRLGAGTIEGAARVVWRVIDPVEREPLAARRPGQSKAKQSALTTWKDASRFRDALHEHLKRIAPSKQRDRRVAAEVRLGGWFMSAITDATNAWKWAAAAREKRANPFEPITRVWALGYGVDVIDDDYIVLVARSLTAKLS
ncbi:MAG: hypothetical protein JNK05_31000 [Myxococcales bacterium]|nr:hypothetical protein [Myxococcales bacterium]